MSKTAEEILKEITGVESVNDDANILCEVSEIKQAMREFAAQEMDVYKYALKADLQSRVNGTRGLEHLSFEDISEIIDTVK